MQLTAPDPSERELPHFPENGIELSQRYLGRAGAGFTLRTYMHLMASSDERTRHPDDAFACYTGATSGTNAGVTSGSDLHWSPHSKALTMNCAAWVT
jgi:hypothetical protein